MYLFVFVLGFVMHVASQFSPTWITSTLVQAKRLKIIDGGTTNTMVSGVASRSGTITFSTAFTSIPYTGYGISGIESKQ